MFRLLFAISGDIKIPSDAIEALLLIGGKSGLVEGVKDGLGVIVFADGDIIGGLSNFCVKNIFVR